MICRDLIEYTVSKLLKSNEWLFPHDLSTFNRKPNSSSRSTLPRKKRSSQFDVRFRADFRVPFKPDDLTRHLNDLVRERLGRQAEVSNQVVCYFNSKGQKIQKRLHCLLHDASLKTRPLNENSTIGIANRVQIKAESFSYAKHVYCTSFSIV